jgi:hypothetical protein
MLANYLLKATINVFLTYLELGGPSSQKNIMQKTPW